MNLIWFGVFHVFLFKVNGHLPNTMVQIPESIINVVNVLKKGKIVYIYNHNHNIYNFHFFQFQLYTSA